MVELFVVLISFLMEERMALNLLENSFFKTLLYNSSFEQLSSNVTGFYQHTNSKRDATICLQKKESAALHVFYVLSQLLA